uniref:SON protein n=1 Tax=Haemonchus contortus TaxID=6289 RepID=A0A7I4YGN9_HAECO
MSSSMVIKRLSEQRFVDSDGSTQRSLAAEMTELTFRPEISVRFAGAQGRSCYQTTTPRKLRNDSPQVLKTVEGMINVSVTNSTDAERVKQELIKVFEQQTIKYEIKGWKISGKQKDKAGHALTVELEVVVVQKYGERLEFDENDCVVTPSSTKRSVNRS